MIRLWWWLFFASHPLNLTATTPVNAPIITSTALYPFHANTSFASAKVGNGGVEIYLTAERGRWMCVEDDDVFAFDCLNENGDHVRLEVTIAPTVAP